MSKGIVLDMDGVICKLYDVPRWLDLLRAENASPYRTAKPIRDLDTINGLLTVLKACGWTVEVVSWLSKGNPSQRFNKAVRANKRQWMKQYLPCVDTKDIHIVKYGTSKWHVAHNKGAILLDDESHNVDTWNKHSNGGHAVQVTSDRQILELLVNLVKDELNKLN